MTVDYTKPEEHISQGHSSEAQELMTPENKGSLAERVSKYGIRLSIASALAATLIGAGHWKYIAYRAEHAPELVKEYCDIGPATKELSEAIEHSKKNYLFGFNKRDFKSGAVVSELERVQTENAASQNEQLGNLSGLIGRLDLRKQEIEEKNPEVAAYLGKTNQVSRYFGMGQVASGEAAAVGVVMFALPYVITGLKRRRDKKVAPTLAEVCKERGIPSLEEIKEDKQ